jgi:hypothetical protein
MDTGLLLFLQQLGVSHSPSTGGRWPFAVKKPVLQALSHNFTINIGIKFNTVKDISSLN